MGIEELCQISRRYGQDPAWVLAGGGNTSFKDESTLYVKASGYPLATLTTDGLVGMDRKKLAAIWKESYPEERDAREDRALKDLMAARLPKQKEKRPSVETLMHDVMPYTYVIHTHPTLVNGLTCAQNGEEEARRLFGDTMVWVPLVDPGYILSKDIKERLAQYKEEHGVTAQILFLQNHGLTVGADTREEIERLHEHIAQTIYGELSREPDTDEPVDTIKQAGLIEESVTAAVQNLEADYKAESGIGRQIRGIEHVRFYTNREIDGYVANKEAFAPLASPFTPDHIVYAGHNPPFIEGGSFLQGLTERVRKGLGAYIDEQGQLPKSVALQGLGAVALGRTPSAVEKAIALFTDAAQIATYTESFGGPRFMEQDKIDFIVNWEVESYREQVSTGG
jgi:rhamnose utilization protein RhaD (predicted bifunctional aldolase and dehydrogenase)